MTTEKAEWEAAWEVWVESGDSNTCTGDEMRAFRDGFEAARAATPQPKPGVVTKGYLDDLWRRVARGDKFASSVVAILLEALADAEARGAASQAADPGLLSDIELLSRALLALDFPAGKAHEALNRIGVFIRSRLP